MGTNDCYSNRNISICIDIGTNYIRLLADLKLSKTHNSILNPEISSFGVLEDHTNIVYTTILSLVHPSPECHPLSQPGQRLVSGVMKVCSIQGCSQSSHETPVRLRHNANNVIFRMNFSSSLTQRHRHLHRANSNAFDAHGAGSDPISSSSSQFILIRKCMWRDINLKRWSADGCVIEPFDGEICECDHLTE